MITPVLTYGSGSSSASGLSSAQWGGAIILVVGGAWILAGIPAVAPLVLAITAGALLFEILKTPWSEFPF